ncbi:PREDICTED: apyrase-like, partial [Diuraphis noxia]|uniref:apyrase-like n=1 Tax=Diuraphis noxia TaxID=143948 RepID=UPI0007636357
MFYELDLLVWGFHNEWTYYEHHPEIVGTQTASSIHLTSFVILAAIATVFGVPVNSDCNCNLITDKRYPLTEPIVKYRIGIVSDLDEKSKSSIESSTWISYFKKGYLTYKPDTKEVFIEWDNSPIPDLLKSHDSVNDRGAELSELVTYDAKLITVDDKTGWVYLIEKNNNLTNWVKLNNGDGNTNKEMKNEWATVKDSKLYVGSHGRELVNGQDIDYSYMWVKTIDKLGNVEHLNWKDNFIKIRKAVNIEYPGYMAHEAVEWSDIHKRWFFLPRKISEEQFDDSADEQKGTNVLLSATSDFEDIK